MSVVGGTVRNVGKTVGRAATVTTEAAGAVGGAAVNGVVGGVTGAAKGHQARRQRGQLTPPRQPPWPLARSASRAWSNGRCCWLSAVARCCCAG